MKAAIASLLFLAGRPRKDIWIASFILPWSTFIATAQLQCCGEVAFANFGPGFNAPISDAAGQLIAWPSPYVADLFYSNNTNAVMDDLIDAGKTADFSASTNYGAGLFVGGIVFLPVDFATVDFLVLAQVRVWDTSYGSTYYEARDKGGEFGFSNLIIATAWPPPGSPGFLIGLQSFQLQRLPYLSISLTLTNTILFFWSVWDVWETSYLVQQNEGLNSTNWISLTNTPVVVGFQHQVTIPKPQGSMFYRLISQ
jgi:hypothetical protein